MVSTIIHESQNAAETIYFDYIDGEFLAPTLPIPEAKHALHSLTLEVTSILKQTSTSDLERALNNSPDKLWQNDFAYRSVLLKNFILELNVQLDNIHQADLIDIGTLKSTCVDFTSWINVETMEKMFQKMNDFPFEKLHKDNDENLIGITRFVPKGKCLIICPSNAPIGSSLPQAILALMAGCSVIVKPSLNSLHSFQYVAKAVHAAGLPKEVFQLVNGGVDVGNYLIKSKKVKAVCFVGSTKVGLQISQELSKNLTPFEMELGGCNPFIVMKDADLNLAVDGLISVLTLINGQYCCGPSNILVHTDVKDEFLKLFMEKCEKDVRLGSSYDENSTMGPLCPGLAVNLLKTMDILRNFPNSKEICSAKLPINEKGYYVPPTIFTNIPKDFVPELFGPVTVLHEFETAEDAIELAMTADARLKGYIFGKSVEDVNLIRENVECTWWDCNLINFGSHDSFDMTGLSGFQRA
ncbi:hypothetical protein HK099_005626, partial [Clydaea vesicula]